MSKVRKWFECVLSLVDHCWVRCSTSPLFLHSFTLHSPFISCRVVGCVCVDMSAIPPLSSSHPLLFCTWASVCLLRTFRLPWGSALRLLSSYRSLPLLWIWSPVLLFSAQVFGAHMQMRGIPAGSVEGSPYAHHMLGTARLLSSWGEIDMRWGGRALILVGTPYLHWIWRFSRCWLVLWIYEREVKGRYFWTFCILVRRSILSSILFFSPHLLLESLRTCFSWAAF